MKRQRCLHPSTLPRLPQPRRREMPRRFRWAGGRRFRWAGGRRHPQKACLTSTTRIPERRRGAGPRERRGHACARRQRAEQSPAAWLHCWAHPIDAQPALHRWRSFIDPPPPLPALKPALHMTSAYFVSHPRLVHSPPNLPFCFFTIFTCHQPLVAARRGYRLFLQKIIINHWALGPQKCK